MLPKPILSSRASQKSDRILLSFTMFFSLFICASWTFRSAIVVFYAIHELKESKTISKNLANLQNGNDLTRKIQQHFSKFDLYIDPDDIIHTNEFNKLSKVTLFSIRKSCDSGKLYVWVPISIKVPLFGEKVIEWCYRRP